MWILSMCVSSSVFIFAVRKSAFCLLAQLFPLTENIEASLTLAIVYQHWLWMSGGRGGYCVVPCLGMLLTRVCVWSFCFLSDVAGIIWVLFHFARCSAAKSDFFCKTWQLTARPGWMQTPSVSESQSQRFKCFISCIWCRALGLFHAEVVDCLFLALPAVFGVPEFVIDFILLFILQFVGDCR